MAESGEKQALIGPQPEEQPQAAPQAADDTAASRLYSKEAQEDYRKQQAKKDRARAEEAAAAKRREQVEQQKYRAQFGNGDKNFESQHVGEKAAQTAGGCCALCMVCIHCILCGWCYCIPGCGERRDSDRHGYRY
jgi:hypothetical protein